MILPRNHFVCEECFVLELDLIMSFCYDVNM